MKKSVSYLYCGIAIAILAAGCQRSIDMNAKQNNAHLAVSNDAATSKCRLMYANRYNGIITEQYNYNADGLLNETNILVFGSPYVYATMQYDNKKNLATSTVSINGGSLLNMSFEYEDNRIIREITYEPGTTNIIEVLVNSYNNKGQIIRRSDATYDIYTDFEYDSEGNNTKSETRVLSTGELIFAIIFNYAGHIKSAETVRPGITQPWWYINEVVSPFAPTRRTEFWPDGAGGTIMTYNEDESQTVNIPAAQNLIGINEAYDEVFDVHNLSYWEYENCGGKAELNKPAGSSVTNGREKDVAFLKMPLLKGASLASQLAEKQAAVVRLRN